MVSTLDLQNTHSRLAFGFNTLILSKKAEDLILPLQASQLRNCTLGGAIFLQMVLVIDFIGPLDDSNDFHTDAIVKHPKECANQRQQSSTKAFIAGALCNKTFKLDTSSSSQENRGLLKASFRLRPSHFLWTKYNSDSPFSVDNENNLGKTSLRL
ncbi:unnamed protein product [Camellia sinensis]